MNFIIVLLSLLLLVSSEQNLRSRHCQNKKCSAPETIISFNKHSYNFKSNEEVEARKKKDDAMSHILPMMVTPFMTSLTFLPMMLISMKVMLLNSMVMGKLAIIMFAITILRNMLKNGGGLFTHNVNVNNQKMQPIGHHHDLQKYNYGYSGGPQSHRIRSRKRKKR